MKSLFDKQMKRKNLFGLRMQSGGALQSMGEFLQPAMRMPYVDQQRAPLQPLPDPLQPNPIVRGLRSVGEFLQPAMPMPGVTPDTQPMMGPPAKLPVTSGRPVITPGVPPQRSAMNAVRGSTGGEVEGPGGPRDDEVGPFPLEGTNTPVFLSNEEYVLPEGAYAALKKEKGGKAGLDRWVQKHNDGIPPRGLRQPAQGMAFGGPLTSGMTQTSKGAFIPDDMMESPTGAIVPKGTQFLPGGGMLMAAGGTVSPEGGIFLGLGGDLLDAMKNGGRRVVNAAGAAGKALFTSPASAPGAAGVGESLAAGAPTGPGTGVPKPDFPPGTDEFAAARDAAIKQGRTARQAGRAGEAARAQAVKGVMTDAGAKMEQFGTQAGEAVAQKARRLGGGVVAGVATGAVESAAEPFYDRDKVANYATNMGMGADKDDSPFWQHAKETAAQGLRTLQNIGDTFGAGYLGRAIARKIGGEDFIDTKDTVFSKPSLDSELGVTPKPTGTSAAPVKTAAPSATQSSAPPAGGPARPNPIRSASSFTNTDGESIPGAGARPELTADGNAVLPNGVRQHVTITDNSTPEQMRAAEDEMHARAAERIRAERYADARDRATNPRYDPANIAAEDARIAAKYGNPSEEGLGGRIMLDNGRTVRPNSIAGKELIGMRNRQISLADQQARTAAIREANILHAQISGNQLGVQMRGQDIDLAKARAANKLQVYQMERDWEKEGLAKLDERLKLEATVKGKDAKGNDVNEHNPELEQNLREYVAQFPGVGEGTPGQRMQKAEQAVRQWKLNQKLQESNSNILGIMVAGRQVKPGNVHAEIEDIEVPGIGTRATQSGTSIIQLPNQPYLKTTGGAYTRLSDVLADGNMSRALTERIEMMIKSGDPQQAAKGRALRDKLEKFRKNTMVKQGLKEAVVKP